MLDLYPAAVAWARLGPGEGREQSGRRPVVVIASYDYLEAIDSLVIAVPVTTRDRDWPNHVALRGPTGLTRPSWAMTEQPLTLARTRLVRLAGRVDDATFAAIRMYLREFLA